MIVDCHTHVWQSPDQLGQLDLGESQRQSRTRTPRLSGTVRPVWRSIPSADADHHYAQAALADKTTEPSAMEFSCLNLFNYVVRACAILLAVIAPLGQP